MKDKIVTLDLKVLSDTSRPVKASLTTYPPKSEKINQMLAQIKNIKGHNGVLEQALCGHHDYAKLTEDLKMLKAFIRELAENYKQYKITTVKLTCFFYGHRYLHFVEQLLDLDTQYRLGSSSINPLDFITDDQVTTMYKDVENKEQQYLGVGSGIDWENIDKSLADSERKVTQDLIVLAKEVAAKGLSLVVQSEREILQREDVMKWCADLYKVYHEQQRGKPADKISEFNKGRIARFSKELGLSDKNLQSLAKQAFNTSLCKLKQTSNSRYTLKKTLDPIGRIAQDILCKYKLSNLVLLAHGLKLQVPNSSLFSSLFSTDPAIYCLTNLLKTSWIKPGLGEGNRLKNQSLKILPVEGARDSGSTDTYDTNSSGWGSGSCEASPDVSPHMAPVETRDRSVSPVEHKMQKVTIVVMDQEKDALDKDHPLSPLENTMSEAQDSPDQKPREEVMKQNSLFSKTQEPLKRRVMSEGSLAGLARSTSIHRSDEQATETSGTPAEDLVVAMQAVSSRLSGVNGRKALTALGLLTEIARYEDMAENPVRHAQPNGRHGL